ncbi:MAG: M15 family metallopeptidase [Acidobacteria bacterium]|nr:M15 family metallopeptidase [Acidobacteriota bacterium]
MEKNAAVAIVAICCVAAIAVFAQSNSLVEVVQLDPTIRIDLRYATDRNFMGKPVYSDARAFLQQPVADAVVSAHRWLKKQGYGLIIYDAYRPWSVTKLFWDIVPPEKRSYVADPATGSRHNRGCAVDVGLYDLATGKEIAMPSPYDELTERASIHYRGGTAVQRAHRDLLRRAMEREGKFRVFAGEWWHYNFRNCNYPVLDIPFSSL